MKYLGLAHSFKQLISTCVKTLVYTLGHILIALSCAVIITGATLSSATVDALVEPLMNAGWYFVLDYSGIIQHPMLKTGVYTIGHVAIAVACIILITGATIEFALIDAFVEPLINAVWYYSLNQYWHDSVRKDPEYFIKKSTA